MSLLFSVYLITTLWMCGGTEIIDESKNRLGPNRCASSAECSTGRVCVKSWCQTKNEVLQIQLLERVRKEKYQRLQPIRASSDPRDKVARNELLNKNGAHMCSSADECSIGRVCTVAGWCAFPMQPVKGQSFSKSAIAQTRVALNSFTKRYCDTPSATFVEFD